MASRRLNPPPGFGRRANTQDAQFHPRSPVSETREDWDRGRATDVRLVEQVNLLPAEYYENLGQRLHRSRQRTRPGRREVRDNSIRRFSNEVLISQSFDVMLHASTGQTLTTADGTTTVSGDRRVQIQSFQVILEAFLPCLSTLPSANIANQFIFNATFNPVLIVPSLNMSIPA